MHSRVTPRRLLLALPLVALMGLGALPASAARSAAPTATPTPAPTATPDPTTVVAQAQQQLQQAQQNAQAQDTALQQVKSQLAGTQATLAILQSQIADLDTAIARDLAQVQLLQVQIGNDRATLGAYMRSQYEHGSNEQSLLYILNASDLGDLLQRQSQVTSVSDAAHGLLARIQNEQHDAQATLDDASARRLEVEAARQQAATNEALIIVQTENLQTASAAAWSAVQNTQNSLSQAIAQKAQADAAAAAARARAGVVYMPVPGVTFTVDTDLTKPSGETADRLDAFLKGSALQGLGPALIAAETKYHVSARYLLAHAIEELAFGTSNIARDKHNLFGYGANDANPYNNAVAFSSFADCVDFVAGKVATNYLDPAGPYFHGPTLRGMNVSYATDTKWADNIARIAVSFP